ncbi:ATP-binding cassette domain-containing protein [Ekhidna sp. To15]|uniref:ATP-binding cassette domain-containing protein n=1 Tax=Ekhidna sp. To15 TaxID=3395267 RepID=UPI003F522040
MSEELLKAIIRLLVIVAKEEGKVDESEKESVREFLYENVSRDDTKHYLKILDEYVKEIDTKDDYSQIDNITTNINNELTQPQKLVVMVKLMELIIADEKITERESDLLYRIGKNFKFEDEVVDAIKHFVVNKDPNEYSEIYSVVVSGAEEPERPRQIFHDQLKGHLSFFKLPKIDTCFFKYYGGDIVSLNGLMISPNKIKVFSTGSSIKGKRTERLYYSDVVGILRDDITESNVSFVAENISYKFDNGNIGLVDINVAESTGRLVAIMGGSGAGKSTLFNVLNGTANPYQGSVRINGIDIYQNAKEVEGIIGNVPQDDLLIEDLTVYQNLYYAAKLCFDKTEKSELNELVNRTLESLGLTEAKDLKVGNPLQKTISGGQRKRLNIGLELLREPSVLFVDEPTSGLSSRDSENIMDLLKELSLRGKMVFVVIHQPSSEIFKMFDKLLILDTGGHQIYYGNPVKAVTYFKNMVEMIDKDQSACIECGNVNPEQIFNIIEMKVVDEYGRFTNKRKYSPDQWHEQFVNNIEIEKVEEDTTKPEKSLDLPNKLKQAKIFLQRDVLAKISNRQYVLINILEAPALALLLALITKYSPDGAGYTFYKNENIPVFFFMSIIVALFMGLTVSAEEIIKDRKILKREAFLHLSKLSYLSSKTLILFCLSAVQTLLFVIVGSLILDIQGMTIWYWIILFSVSCFANILGLNISAGFNSVITVYILIPLLIIPQLILSGVVVDFDKLNSSFANQEKVPFIGEMMASRWAYEALAVTQFRDNPSNKDLYPLDREVGINTYKSVYYAKYLQEHLDYCYENKDFKGRDAHLDLIRTEVKKQLSIFGEDKLTVADQLTNDSLTDKVYQETADFLSAIRSVYNSRRKKAKDELDARIAERTKTPELEDEYIKFRNRYENERISIMLKNISTKRRIVTSGDELVQKIYPIYAKNEFPDGPLDFRTNFYYPEKHFAGMYMDTKVFNLIIIWLMTLVLFIAVYYDWLRRIIRSGKF